MISEALIGRRGREEAILIGRATTLILRSSRRASEAFSTIRLGAVGKIWRRLRRDLFDTYRPELHYMRGPGPKWHEKRAQEVRRADVSALAAGSPQGVLQRI